MKSIAKNRVPVPDYPCLMMYKDDGGGSESCIIVLFSASQVGTVVYQYGQKPRSRSKLATHSATWNMSIFEPFNGSVVLNPEEGEDE